MLVSMLLLNFSVALHAQLNLNAGYNLAYFNPEITNQIVADFDEAHPEFDNQLEQINFVYGVLAGVSYRISDLGLSATWYNQSRNRVVFFKIHN